MANEQIPWLRDNVIGHVDNEYTEGFGAIDDILQGYSSVWLNVLDVGGGAFDTNCMYTMMKYLISDCQVYDLFQRSALHNNKVVHRRHYKTCFSFSVLNVINTQKARLQHIRLCLNCLKYGGKAYFKVWSGNQSGIGEIISGGFQSNNPLRFYMNEIESVFGSFVKYYNTKNDCVIIAQNMIEEFDSGSKTFF